MPIPLRNKELGLLNLFWFSSGIKPKTDPFPVRSNIPWLELDAYVIIISLFHFFYKMSATISNRVVNYPGSFFFFKHSLMDLCRAALRPPKTTSHGLSNLQLRVFSLQIKTVLKRNPYRNLLLTFVIISLVDLHYSESL